jgi:uncharacterized membrane protein SpoIIM required for sporulation
MDVTLKSQRFRREREADWQRLEDFIMRIEDGRSATLSEDEILAIPLLYRGTLSSLSVARAISLDQSLLDYLESLSMRAYFCVYGARATLGERLVEFFAEDWPRAVRSLWRETLAAGGLTLLGFVAAILLMRHSPEWFGAFVPNSLAEGRGPEASADALRSTLFSHHTDALAVLSAFLFTHNAQIAIFAFALGFACCLPTAGLMLYNGLTLGAFFAVFAAKGLGAEFGGWVFIHGVTELFAVTLAGAAGFHLGWTLAFPGERSRLDALAEAGRVAATTMAGVVVMLAVAGLLEGFARQLITMTSLRYAVAVTTAILWSGYFYRVPVRQ